MQNQEKVIAAIAAYLEDQTNLVDPGDNRIVVDFGSKNIAHFTHAGFCKEVAEEIAAAIAPHLEAGAGWEDAPSWAEWKARDKYGAINYFEYEPTAGEEEWYYGGKHEQCGEIPYWTNALERRPK